MKHIILRGARGVGKSTLLRRLLAETNAKVGGFATVKAPPDADGISYIHIYPASQPISQRQPTAENCVGSCKDGRLLTQNAAVFDTVGVRELSDTDGCKVLLMDELGFLESDAQAFQQAVLRALDGDIPVLAAVKEKEIPFLERVCSHPNARVFTVTPENRTQLHAGLLPMLRDLFPTEE